MSIETRFLRVETTVAGFEVKDEAREDKNHFGYGTMPGSTAR
jgi:hypothetical protein